MFKGLKVFKSGMITLLCGVISLYQHTLSHVLGNNCRFHPSCSSYVKQALLAHGIIRGSWLSAGRLSRCHPWNPGGIDPVPQGKITHLKTPHRACVSPDASAKEIGS